MMTSEAEAAGPALLPELTSGFKKLHEQRVSLYDYFEREFLEFLKNSFIDQPAAIMRYELLLKSVTFEMTQICQAIRDLKTNATSQGLDELANLIDNIQNLEREKFQLTAHFQLSIKSKLTATAEAPQLLHTDQDVDNLSQTLEYRAYQQAKNRLHELINEQIDEMQCLLDT